MIMGSKMIIDFLHLNVTEDEYIEYFQCLEQLEMVAY
jgi:hypothetical protein